MDRVDLPAKPKLYDFGKNLHSQCGEDGIIEKIFDVIGTTSKICIEFGAWDGFHLSNTAALWTKDWKGILIEADHAKYLHLANNVMNFHCVPIHASVSHQGEDSLEFILQKHGITTMIDLLSIDIDGNEYYIFQSLAHLKPRVIICEYNPTMPAHIDVYSELNQNSGCSVAALNRIARSKGYELVALTELNAFFVLQEDFGKFSMFETSLEHIRIDKYLSYLISSYSGEYKCISLSGLPFGANSPLKQNLNGNFIQPIRDIWIK